MLNSDTVIIDENFSGSIDGTERLIFKVNSHNIENTQKRLQELQEKYPLAQYIFVLDDISDLQIILSRLHKIRVDHVTLNDNLHEFAKVEPTYTPPPTASFSSDSKGPTFNGSIESLQKILLAIHKSRSVREIESRLNEVLQRELKLEWARIFFQSHDVAEQQIEKSKGFTIYKVNIPSLEGQSGRVLFAKKTGSVFTKSEKTFLEQVAEAVGLSLNRLSKLQQAEVLKQQWEITFDSISEPLCLTNSNFEIIRCNRAFVRLANKSFEKLKGQNCFSYFDEENPTSESNEVSTQQSFHLKKRILEETHIFDVNCQKILTNSEDVQLHLLMFKDITENLKIERQILNSAKMAELGTIGSSIAHELNNPLGGMLNFIQLLRMDLSENDPLKEDVQEMEEAGRRCKEIVENLLGFSRMHDLRQLQEIDLREVIQKSIDITEIEIRSSNIELSTDLPRNAVLIQGNVNLLTQALRNILQNATEAIAEKTGSDPRYKGRVDVQLHTKNSKISLEITDNGPGILPKNINKVMNPLFSTKTSGSNSGLGLTVAFTIIKEHGGSLEISSQPNIGTTAKISF